MSDYFDALEQHEAQKEADALDGWEAVQAILAEDEEWARHLYEQFHGAEY